MILYTGRRHPEITTQPWRAFDGQIIESPIWLSPSKDFAKLYARQGYIHTVEVKNVRIFPETPLRDFDGRWLNPSPLGEAVLAALEAGVIFQGLDEEDVMETFKAMDRGDYDVMETGAVINWLKGLGYDGMTVTGDGQENIALWNLDKMFVTDVERV